MERKCAGRLGVGLEILRNPYFFFFFGEVQFQEQQQILLIGGRASN